MNPVTIKIQPWTLKGIRQIAPSVFQTGRGQQMRRALMGSLKDEAALRIMLSGQLKNLSMLSEEANRRGVPIIMSTCYSKKGRPYDTDNALAGINKIFVDSLVQMGALIDDNPKRLVQRSPVCVKNVARHEEDFIQMDFQLSLKEIGE